MPKVISISRDESSGEAFVEVGTSKYHITLSDLEKSGLEAGVEAEGEAIEFLCFADSKLSCIKKALVYLSYGDLSSRKLRSKLSKNFEDSVISEVLKLLTVKGYIDDGALCGRLAEGLQRFKLFGRAKIRSELFVKGFSAEDISAALESLDEDIYEENLSVLIAKKCDNRSNLADFSEKKKLSTYLFRLGYAYDEILNALERFERE